MKLESKKLHNVIAIIICFLIIPASVSAQAQLQDYFINRYQRYGFLTWEQQAGNLVMLSQKKSALELIEDTIKMAQAGKDMLRYRNPVPKTEIKKLTNNLCRLHSYCKTPNEITRVIANAQALMRQSPEKPLSEKVKDFDLKNGPQFKGNVEEVKQIYMNKNAKLTKSIRSEKFDICIGRIGRGGKCVQIKTVAPRSGAKIVKKIREKWKNLDIESGKKFRKEVWMPKETLENLVKKGILTKYRSIYRDPLYKDAIYKPLKGTRTARESQEYTERGMRELKNLNKRPKFITASRSRWVGRVAGAIFIVGPVAYSFYEYYKGYSSPREFTKDNISFVSGCAIGAAAAEACTLFAPGVGTLVCFIGGSILGEKLGSKSASTYYEFKDEKVEREFMEFLINYYSSLSESSEKLE